MLEIRDLVKVYKTKGGVEVRALDGVSLAFPERGMVFLLGKSGSGKSTLLNICGGLDTPDSGEIIIKGRSSKDFTQSDFDSYRNTYVGFVFQEYNILNEFSVEDNIALALELQGRGKDRNKVQEILQKVDLAGYTKRKPNTLSGGQKQRVAIARALVKEPEIIMADEPTGALDSATGRQVLDTLKKLSAEKLVIVVSHDREFAETYGDRIIELKDGKVIADITKTTIAARAESENLSFIGDDTIAVKSGTALTGADIERINKFLQSSPNDLIICCGEREISDFKRAAKIDERGAREAFRDTAEGDIQMADYSSSDCRLIRSRLPARHAMRIGASSLKVKPLRLFFTILLSFIAFTMFGLFSTMTFYDYAATATETYATSDITEATVYKNYRYTLVYGSGGGTTQYETSDRINFTADDLEEFRSRFGQDVLGVFNYKEGYSTSERQIFNAGGINLDYYSAEITGFAQFVPEAWQGRMLTEGDISALADDEIIISSYTFDSLKAAGLTDEDGNAVELNDYADIVGKTLLVTAYYPSEDSAARLKVAGVYANDLPQKYDVIKRDGSDSELYGEFRSTISYGSYRLALVSDDFRTAHMLTFTNSNGREYISKNLYKSMTVGGSTGELISLNLIQSLPVPEGDTPDIAFFDGRAQTQLNDGEIVLPYSALSRVTDAVIDDEIARRQQQIADAPEAEREQLLAELDDYAVHMGTVQMILTFGYYTNTEGENLKTVYATPEETESALKEISELIEKYSDSDYLDDGLEIYPGGDRDNAQSFTLVGFFYGIDGNRGIMYMSSADCEAMYEEHCLMNVADDNRKITNYVPPEGAVFESFMLSLPQSRSGLQSLFSAEFAVAPDDTYFQLATPISSTLSMVSSTIDMLENIFLWIGVAMAVFAMLLLFNFISVSITYKKREIGILRAVGARSTDVFKIFYSESAIITAICYVLAMIAAFIISAVLNAELAAEIGINIAIFVFGPVSWLIMLGIALATSLIATFLPVYSIARRRPVDSIRAV